MLQEQIIEEIKQIPNNKLVEIYDLVHYFRLGLGTWQKLKYQNCAGDFLSSEVAVLVA